MCRTHVIGQFTRHACVIGQYASFARAVRTVALEWVPNFMHLASLQRQLNCYFYSLKHLTDGYLFPQILLEL